MTVEIEQADPRNLAASQLLQASHALMQELFPAESNHYLSVDALCVPSIHFYVAKVDGKTQGCGALSVKHGYGEIKSMFVDPAARGYGLASKLLDQLEAKAIELNLGSLKLETGDVLHQAHRLYERHGFQRCQRFGDYEDDPNSLFMKKSL